MQINKSRPNINGKGSGLDKLPYFFHSNKTSIGSFQFKLILFAHIIIISFESLPQCVHYSTFLWLSFIHIFFFTNAFNSLINFVLFCFSIIHNINSPSVSNYFCPILLPASHWMVENGNESFSSNPGPIFFHIELIFLFNSQIRQELIDTQIWFFCQTDFDLSHWLQ